MPTKNFKLKIFIIKRLRLEVFFPVFSCIVKLKFVSNIHLLALSAMTFASVLFHVRPLQNFKASPVIFLLLKVFIANQQNICDDHLYISKR